jgi:hypothetical protein
MIDRWIPTVNNHDLPDDAVQRQLHTKTITFDGEYGGKLRRSARMNEECLGSQVFLSLRAQGTPQRPTSSIGAQG